jgi:hypothetical protein
VHVDVCGKAVFDACLLQRRVRPLDLVGRRRRVRVDNYGGDRAILYI